MTTIKNHQLIEWLQNFDGDREVLLGTLKFAEYQTMTNITDHPKDNKIVLEGSLWLGDDA